MKVPLSVGFLSEAELLPKALSILKFHQVSISSEGVSVQEEAPSTNLSIVNLSWKYDLLFTLNQLEQLGFER